MLQILRKNSVLLASAVALLALGTQSPAMAQTGYISKGPEYALERLNLKTGEPKAIIDLGITSVAFSWAPGGRLYLANTEVVPDSSSEVSALQAVLHVFDLESHSLETIGTMSDIERVSDLAFDEAGHRLWAISDEMLYSVDHETASTQKIGGSTLTAVGFWQGELWGIQQVSSYVWSLVTLDPEDGQATVIGPVIEDETLTRVEMTMDFDREGNVWILELRTPYTPTLYATKLYRGQGLDPETVEVLHDFGYGIRRGLAISRAPEVVEIPTLGNSGRVLLILLLVAGASTALRRRL